MSESKINVRFWKRIILIDSAPVRGIAVIGPVQFAFAHKLIWDSGSAIFQRCFTILLLVNALAAFA